MKIEELIKIKEKIQDIENIDIYLEKLENLKYNYHNTNTDDNTINSIDINYSLNNDVWKTNLHSIRIPARWLWFDNMNDMTIQYINDLQDIKNNIINDLKNVLQ